MAPSWLPAVADAVVFGEDLSQQDFRASTSDRRPQRQATTHHHALNTAELPVGTAQSKWCRCICQWLASRFLTKCSAVEGYAYTKHLLPFTTLTVT